MTDPITNLTAWWWALIAVSAVRVTPPLLVALVVERVLPFGVWPSVRRAVVVAALLLVMLPPGLAAGWSAGLVDIHAASNWVMDAAVVPDGLTTFAVAAVIVWLVGVVVVASATIGLTYRARRRWRAGATKAPPRVAELAVRAGEQLGLRRLPRVVVSTTVETPCVTGTWRATVFLPAAVVSTLSDDRIRHVLIHEFAHVLRRDLLAAAVVATVRVVYWFHPLVWWAEHRLAALRELGADRTVARALESEATDYRRTLLFFAARAVGDPRALALAFVRPTTLILARLRWLERRPTNPWVERGVAGLLIGVVVLAVVPAAHDASAAAQGVADIIERPPGCLPLRYLVLKRLADAKQGEDP